MPTPIKKRSGKASTIVVNAVPLSIVKYGPKVKRECADTTDSADYDSGSDMVHKTQEPVSLQTELSVEGKLHLDSYDANLMALLYSGISAVPVVLGLDAGTLFGHGLFDLTEFDADVPLLDVITFTCTLMSHGLFTHGA